MRRSRPRPAYVAGLVLLTLCAIFALQTAQAQAAFPFKLPNLKPKAPPTPVIQPVQAPISADPAGPPRGTMILVHAGGWAGHDGYAQNELFKNPGDLFLARGWRVVSIDYDEGPNGLQDLLNVAGAELARRSSDGPLCVYGESSGGHLALMAAVRLRAIDCVIGVGTPTDLYQYTVEASTSNDDRVKLVSGQIMRLFGTTPEATAAWNLVALAPSIRADVMLVHETDDELVTASHAQRFQAARPTTQLIELQPGDPNNPSTDFMHGTVSDVGRGQYMSGIGSFADRAVTARAAEREASRAGCAHVSRSVSKIGPKGLSEALRCLARKAAKSLPSNTSNWRETSVNLRGEVNAARVWSYLRSTTSGKRALAAALKRRAKVIVRTGDRSRVILRAARKR
jgi:acetyl esterase/lipase